MFEPTHPSCLRVDVAGTGFTVLDRIYADGDLAEEALGGSCGNVLVSLALLHRQVAPVLALGGDETGTRLIAEFAEAGAVVSYIALRSEIRSPILAQSLNTLSGEHRFSFVCPETNEDLPRFRSIGNEDLDQAMPVLTNCRVFYADRISDSILAAMRAASSAGAIVYFEPSDVGDGDLFEQALRLTSILKYSEDRLGTRLANRKTDCVRIVTHGAAGLELRDATRTLWCEAIRASNVLDTCGSGDMVSVGVIDWMLSTGAGVSGPLDATHLLDGILAGQRLAAENCAYAGARGLFRSRGAGYVRQLLMDTYSAATA